MQRGIHVKWSRLSLKVDCKMFIPTEINDTKRKRKNKAERKENI
jgi:hypothetical protein